MELKRLGLANKPMIVVPNHLTGQMAAEFIHLYPAANILLTTKKDFEKITANGLLAKFQPEIMMLLLLDIVNLKKFQFQRNVLKITLNMKLKMLQTLYLL